MPRAPGAAGDGWRRRRLPRVPGAAEGLPAARGAGMPGARHAAQLPSGGASNKSWGPRTWHDLFQAPRWCARSRSEVARGVCESGRVPGAGPVGLSGARCQLGGRGPVPSGGCPMPALWVCPVPTRWSGAEWPGAPCQPCGFARCPVPTRSSGAGAQWPGAGAQWRVPGAGQPRAGRTFGFAQGVRLRERCRAGVCG